MSFPCRVSWCCGCAGRAAVCHSCWKCWFLVKPTPSSITACEAALTDTPRCQQSESCFFPDVNRPELKLSTNLLSWIMKEHLWSPGSALAAACSSLCCFLCPGTVWSSALPSFSSPHQQSSTSLKVNAVTAPSCRRTSLEKWLIPSHPLFYWGVVGDTLPWGREGQAWSSRASPPLLEGGSVSA